MKRQMLSLLAAAALLVPAYGQSPKRELRSTWLTTVWAIDWPNSKTPATAQKQMIQYIENLKAHNFNGVCFQVRSLADAMYKSSYEPWSSQLTGTRGKDPGWDPLQFCIDECHKRGMECYAWVNPYRESSSANIQNSSYDTKWQNDGWLLSNGSYIVFNPGLPEARAHILKVIKEIYTNYKIDGMLFDDYFYPSGGTATGTSSPDYALWKASGTTMSQADWRRDNINKFMKEIYDNIQADRPDMRFGLSPAGVAGKSSSKYGCPGVPVPAGDWQYDQIYSDPLAWLHDGSVDFISPQLYWVTTHATAPFEPLTKWWTTVADKFGRHFYASHSISLLADNNTEANWADIAKQVRLHRENHTTSTPGNIYYSAKNIDGLNGGVRGLGSYLEQNVYQSKALVPVITWKEHTVYSAPSGAVLKDNTLSWDAVKADPKAIIRYTIYAIPTDVPLNYAMEATGDGISSRYLVDVSYDTSYTLDASKVKGYYHAVCVYDGYGYESEPAVIGTHEVGEYVPTKDPATYDKTEGYVVESMWMRSAKDGFNNFDVEENGSFNRGMVATDNYVYVSGRTANSSTAGLYLRVYDANTGEYVRDLELSTNGQGGYYPCNDVIKDSKGNVCITNLTLNISSTPLKVHSVNTQTGALTEVASLTAPLGRVDHAGVYGDVTTGNFYVFAAVASNSIVYRWKVTNGKAGNVEQMTAKKFHPTTSTGFGIAPRVHAVSETAVYVDGQSISATLYDFATGNIIDSPTATTAPKKVTTNGACAFKFDDKNFAVYAATAAEDGHAFHIAMSDKDNVLGTGKVLWSLPKGTLGAVNSTTCSAPVDALTDDESARVYTYAPGNGIAAYRISKDKTGIESASIETGFKVNGREVVFAEKQSSIKAYDMSGSLVATITDSAVLRMPNAGIFLIVTENGGTKVTIL